MTMPPGGPGAIPAAPDAMAKADIDGASRAWGGVDEMKPKPRQNRALRAMRAYTGEPQWRFPSVNGDTDLTDLLADLMHLAGIDIVDHAYESAAWHFNAETGEEV